MRANLSHFTQSQQTNPLLISIAQFASQVIVISKMTEQLSQSSLECNLHKVRVTFSAVYVSEKAIFNRFLA